MDQIYTALSVSIEKLMQTNFVKEEKQKEAIVKKTTTTDKEKKEIVSKLDEVNQPYYIENQDKTFSRPLNSFDCLQIRLQIEKIKNDPLASMVVVSPFEMIIIDLLTMRVSYWNTTHIEGFENEKLKLVKGVVGTRRQRPRDSQRHSDFEFQLRTDDEFA